MAPVLPATVFPATVVLLALGGLFAPTPATAQALPAVREPAVQEPVAQAPAVREQAARTPGVAPAESTSRPPAGFSVRTLADEEGEHQYSLFVPRTPPPPGGYPIVLFLHGAYERGTDGERQTTVGLGPIVRDDPDFPAVVVFPQVEDPDGRILPAWNPDRPDGARALKILEQAEGLLPIDPAHRVLAGWSMGGYGVLGQLAQGDPLRWSAAVSVASGRSIELDVEALAAASRVTPLWVVAGSSDRFVPFIETQDTVRAIREFGGRVRFTQVRNAGHDVWKTAFSSDRFRAILQNPRVVAPRAANEGPGEVDQTLVEPPADQLPDVDPVPGEDALPSENQLPDEDEFDRLETVAAPLENFQPELILERGAFVRADNALLEKLVRQYARSLPADSLTGTIPDQNITRDALGHKIHVFFSGIRYSGRVTDAALIGRAGNYVTARVEVVDASVTVQRIFMRAPLGHRGFAGPIAVRAGVRRPLVLEVDIRPSVVNNELKLTALSTRFALPPDDYFVCGPGCVDEDGLFLTEQKLAKTLVEGLYEARSQGEQAVRDAVPDFLQNAGSGVSLGNPAGLTGDLLPLPLIEPSIQVQLAGVQADENGLNAIFDLAIGAPEDHPPHPPRREDGGVTFDLATGAGKPEGLAVGVSASLVRVLSGQLVEEGVPRIDARDVPGNPLARLHERENLIRIVPGLSRPEYADDELRARLTLVGPMSAIAQDSRENALVRMESDAVELTIDHLPANGDWQRAGVVRLALRQPIRAAVRKNGSYRNFLALAEGEAARIAALDAQPVIGDRVDGDLAATLVGEGWDNWLDDEGPFSGPLQDFDLPGAALRIEELNSRGPATGATDGLVIAEFTVPDTALENRSELTLTYRVREEPNGAWGGPFTLAPGETHTYKVREPLRFEQIGVAPDGGDGARTLEVGKTYQFHVPVGAVYPTLDAAHDLAEELSLYQKDPRPWRQRAPIAGREVPTVTAAPPAAGVRGTVRTVRGPVQGPALSRGVTPLRSPVRN
ncbi:Alpha/beta hydrolase family protein [Alienimonas californiensis]|uniref:Alpha/beta hydrolase family protein n=2 Tax=Alienimonas californiensis TaxID=2527989 RepID=A0A517PFC2_9PLAN|nr:Alpha/beta hydrolase family protein [Alienimonas californiensis]